MKKLIKEREVLFGLKGAKRMLESGEAEKIILSENSPKYFEEELKKFPTEKVGENSREIGEICGKPFNISVLTVKKKEG